MKFNEGSLVFLFLELSYFSSIDISHQKQFRHNIKQWYIDIRPLGSIFSHKKYSLNTVK